jgi:acetolactate synthase regulatory subunit
VQLDNKNAVRRFKVLAESGPGTLIRVLQLIQARNLVPRRAQAQRMGGGYLEIEVEVDAQECAAEAFRLVVAKLNELSVVLVATECE